MSKLLLSAFAAAMTFGLVATSADAAPRHHHHHHHMKKMCKVDKVCRGWGKYKRCKIVRICRHHR